VALLFFSLFPSGFFPVRFENSRSDDTAIAYTFNKLTCFSAAGQVSGGISAIMYKEPCAAVDITSDAFYLNDLDVFGMHNFLPPGTLLYKECVQHALVSKQDPFCLHRVMENQ
jgi:hypothetical protein